MNVGIVVSCLSLFSPLSSKICFGPGYPHPWLFI
jgi:hypothetical protein